MASRILYFKASVNGERYRVLLNEFLYTKIEQEFSGNIWFQQDGATCHTAEATLDVLSAVFEDCIISRRADVVWPPRSSDLTPLDYHTIDNVLKNWTDRVGYYMASRGSHLNEIIFHY